VQTCALPIFGPSCVPPYYFSLLISEGVVTSQEPTILPILQQDPMFRLEWKPSLQSHLSLFPVPLDVLVVENSFAETRCRHILRGQSRQVERCLVGIKRRPGWIKNY